MAYTTLHQLRSDAITALIPIVLMTATADLAGMRHGMDLGADDYLPKPFSAEALKSSVEKQFDKQERLRRESDRQLEELRTNLNLALPHEFNTPLNGIIASAQLIKDGIGDEDPTAVRELANCILVSGNRLFHVVRSFLTYAEIEVLAHDAQRSMHLRRERTASAGAIAAEVAKEVAGAVTRRREWVSVWRPCADWSPFTTAPLKFRARPAAGRPSRCTFPQP